MSAGNDGREDAAMLAGFLAGETGGLESVYLAYGKSLYALARHVLGNDDDAQDCVHDALLRAWQRSGSYRTERGSLRAYLLGCVRNEALARKRTAARHFRIEKSAMRDEPVTYEFDVSDGIERQRVRAALAALPPEQRAALDLAYFSRLTHVEVANRLGVPLGTIKSRIASALRKVGAALNGDAARAL